MKNLIVALVLVLFCMNVQLKAQQYKAEKIAVFYFTINSAEDIKMNFKKSQRDSIYNSIIQTLTAAGLQFYPLDHLRPKMWYNEFEYPQQFESKARKSGLSKAYAKIEVDFINAGGLSTRSSGNLTISGVGGAKDKITTKVKCIISVKVVSDKGAELLKTIVEKDSKDRIPIQTDALIFGKFVMPSYDQKEGTAESLQTLVNETILELSNNIK